MQAALATTPFDLIGWAAAAFTLLAFTSRDLRWLRSAAVCSSVAFILYATATATWPVLALHAVLLPLNLLRLLEMRREWQVANAAAGRPLVSTCRACGKPHPIGAQAAAAFSRTAVALVLLGAAWPAHPLTLTEGQTVVYTGIGTIDLSDGLLHIEGGALVLDSSDSLDLSVPTQLTSGSITGNAARSVLNLDGQTAVAGTLFPLIGGLAPGSASLLTVNRGYLLQLFEGQLQLQGRSSFVNADGAHIVAGGQLIHSGILRIEAGGTLRNGGTLQVSGRAAETWVLGWLDNTGVFHHDAGGSLQSVDGTLHNAAQATMVIGSTATPGANALRHTGRIVNDSGGSVTLNGNSSSLSGSLFQNDGSLQNNDFWSLDGRLTVGDTGSVVNAGTLVLQPGGRLQIDAGGSLDNAGSLMLYGGPLTVAGGARLASAGGAIQMFLGSTMVVEGVLDLAFDSGLYMNPGSNVTGQGTLLNAGVVYVAAGASVALQAVAQTAGELRVDGRLDSNAIIFVGGVLTGSGLINAAPVRPIHRMGAAGVDAGVLIGRSAVLRPGDLTLLGNLVVDAGGSVEFDVSRLPDGSLAWGRLSATSVRFLDGSTVTFVIGDGVAGDAVQTLSFLDCAAGCTFASGVSFVVDGAHGAQIAFGSEGIELSLPPVQAVPEPASALLMLAGLLALRRLNGGQR